MSRTSETNSNEVRCGNCNRCLVKDSQLACPRCGQRCANINSTQVALTMVGHALVSELTAGAPKVVALQIHPTPNSLGFVRSDSSPEPLPTREELLARLTSALAMPLAEEMISGSGNSTSSAVVLSTCYSIAMLIAVHIDGCGPDNLQAACERIVQDCKARATQTLLENRSTIERLAQVLASKGSLSGDEFRSLLGK